MLSTHNKDVGTMVRAAFFLVLIFLHSAASAESAWKGTSQNSKVTGSGDVLDSSGSSLALTSAQTGNEGFSGAITSLDAEAYRGREVVISGILQVEEGAGSGAIWIRADRLGERLDFQSTSNDPVRLLDGAQAREIRLYVPLAATSLKLGITMGDAGSIRAKSLKLRGEAASSSGVSAYEVLDAALSIMRTKALNRAKVEWQAERAQLLTSDLKNIPAQEAYSRIRIALAKLGDRHSSLQAANRAAQYRDSAIPTQALEAGASGDIGYLRLPGLMGSDSESGRKFASSVCRSIEEMADKASYGVIIDLRGNRGGNMWPMINGLRPLLGSGDIGAFRDSNGNTTSWRSRTVGECKTDMTTKPVAVLIGSKTASSGEAVAIAFKGRPDTRFFGRPTAGLSTGNVNFPLPDGSALTLTTSADVDRSGQVFLDGLTPDVQVEDGQDAIETARSWLQSFAQ